MQAVTDGCWLFCRALFTSLYNYPKFGTPFKRGSRYNCVLIVIAEGGWSHTSAELTGWRKHSLTASLCRWLAYMRSLSHTTTTSSSRLCACA